MSKAVRLQPFEAIELMGKNSLWECVAELGGVLRRTVMFANFSDAFAFMTRVALLAERSNHHPEWFNLFNRVEITLTTHEAGGISSRDIEMAHAIDELVPG